MKLLNGSVSIEIPINTNCRKKQCTRRYCSRTQTTRSNTEDPLTNQNDSYRSSNLKKTLHPYCIET